MPNEFYMLCNAYVVSMLSILYITLAAYFALHKKWSFLLGILSVNVTKSAVYCWFGFIYWINP